MIATFDNNNNMPTGTATASQVPKFEIVNRLDGVPAIHDSVAYAHALLQSTPLTASLYSTAVGIANKSYELATPVLSKSKPLFESADGLAVATFDRAQATFPYAFKTPTEDLIVVKQAKGIFDARIAPAIGQAQPAVYAVYTRTVEINNYFLARASDTVKSSGNLGEALVDQLKYLASHGKELPAELINAVSQTSGEVKNILLAKDTNIQDKSNKIGAYVVDKVKPVVDQVYNYLLGAKRKAEEEAAKAVDKAGDVADQATDKANEVAR